MSRDVPATGLAGLYKRKRMKLRDAAVLVLVGWYLMIPPTTDPQQTPDDLEPLSEWKVVEEFQSEAACQDMRSKLIARMGAQISSARCISSDNPKLHEKRQTNARENKPPPS